MLWIQKITFLYICVVKLDMKHVITCQKRLSWYPFLTFQGKVPHTTTIPATKGAIGGTGAHKKLPAFWMTVAMLGTPTASKVSFLSMWTATPSRISVNGAPWRNLVSQTSWCAVQYMVRSKQECSKTNGGPPPSSVGRVGGPESGFFNLLADFVPISASSQTAQESKNFHACGRANTSRCCLRKHIPCKHRVGNTWG